MLPWMRINDSSNALWIAGPCIFGRPARKPASLDVGRCPLPCLLARAYDNVRYVSAGLSSQQRSTKSACAAVSAISCQLALASQPGAVEPLPDGTLLVTEK